jgi:transcriptional regulator
MYRPAAFAEEHVAALHGLMRAQPFATLVSCGADAVEITHLPLLHDPAPAPWGTLRGHVARANPHWRQLASGGRALAIFMGPHGYISPSWYPSKRIDGKAVPTWNYAVVHARVSVRVIHDAAWLRRLVADLTERFESGLEEPWRISDAPAAFIEQMLRGIVGFDMTIEALEGKWKLSQNRSLEDRTAVVTALQRRGDAQSQALAAVVAEASGIRISATVD